MKKIIVNILVLLLFLSCSGLLSAVGKRYYEGRMQVVYEEHISRDNSNSTTIDEFLTLVYDIPDQDVQDLVEDIKQVQLITLALQILLFPLFGWILTRANKSKPDALNY